MVPKLYEKSNESAQECMGRLWTKVKECEFKDYDRLLTEEFIGGIDNDGNKMEILREVAALEDYEDVMSESTEMGTKSGSREGTENCMIQHKKRPGNLTL